MHLIKCCIMQSTSHETIISAHIALIHVQFYFEAKSSRSLSLTPYVPCSLSCFLSPVILFFFLSCFILCLLRYPLHLANSSPPLLRSSVGRLLIEFSSQMTMERVQKENPNVTEGGRYTPPDCRPRWKVCMYSVSLPVGHMC